MEDDYGALNYDEFMLEIEEATSVDDVMGIAALLLNPDAAAQLDRRLLDIAFTAGPDISDEAIEELQVEYAKDHLQYILENSGR